jgi:hypothetical protein
MEHMKLINLKSINKSFVFILQLIMFIDSAQSQDIIGGSLTLREINSISFQRSLYLNINPQLAVDRSFICYEFDTVYLFDQTQINSNEHLNLYIDTITFSGNGIYNINFVDSFRINNINNINNIGFSIFEIECSLLIAYPFIFNNHPPTFTKSIPNYFINNSFCTLNINAADSDGDSLAFRLDTCLAVDYSMPQGASINSITGEFSFSGFTNGFYSFLIILEEWRNGVKINEYPKDFAINLNNTSLNDLNPVINNDLLYPNPTNNIVYFKQDNILNIEIYNIVGDRMNCHFEINKNGILELDMSVLNSGLYFISLYSNKNRVINYKITKL